MNNVTEFPPTRAQVFGVTQEHFDECNALDELIDRAFPGQKNIPVDDMLILLLTLCAQLRCKVRELDARLAVFDDPTRCT